MQKENIFKNIN